MITDKFLQYSTVLHLEKRGAGVSQSQFIHPHSGGLMRQSKWNHLCEREEKVNATAQFLHFG